MATTYLNRTLTAGNRKTFTYSLWLKRSKLAANMSVFSAARGDVLFRFGTSDDLQFRDINNSTFNLSTNNVFRDVSAFYHFVIAVDTTQATASNRIKLYVNGTQQTSDFGTETYPSQNLDTDQNNNGDTMYVGARTDSGGSLVTSQILDGYISQFIFADGTAYDASTFGSTNANGVWVPNTSPSVTYGTNGFKLDFVGTGATANSSGFGADTSGNDNHFTSNSLGTNPSVKDTPHNNFCTINLLSQQPSNPCSITEGSLKAENTSSANTDNNQSRVLGTMFPTTGKWYTEIKYVSGYSATDGSVMVGLASSDVGKATTYSYGFNKNNGNDSHTVGYGNNGKIWYNGSEQTTGLTTFTTGDILGMAMDLTNGKFFVSKNGTFFSNGTGTQDPANGTNPLYSSTNIQNPSAGMTPGIQLYSSPNGVAQFNYGNPSFSISSGNADANGYGNFEYAVPSGFYALCTKNLAQYG